MINDDLVGGFNLPLWKIWPRQLGWLFPIYGKNKNVPNHQPELITQKGLSMSKSHSCKSPSNATKLATVTCFTKVYGEDKP